MTNPPVDELFARTVPGRQVSDLILGGPFGVEPLDTTFSRLDHFAEIGGALVETARGYDGGQGEIALGRWVVNNPETLRIVTKVGHDPVDGRDIPLDRHTVEQHVDASRRALGVDSIDLLLYHGDDDSRSVEELAETLAWLVSSGRARSVGASNWSAERFDGLASALGPTGLRPAGSYQFSLAVPDPERLRPGNRAADDDVLAVVDRRGLPLLAWSAQATGFFARTEPKTEPGRWRLYETPDNVARRERARRLADDLGTRPETVALAWVLHHSGVWPALGPRTDEQLDRSVDALAIRLSDEQVRWVRTGDR